MSKVRLQAIIRDEAGNKLGGTGYEVRWYQKGTSTLATLYSNDTTGVTIPNPHYPNAGISTTLGNSMIPTDTTALLGNIAGYQIGDFITFDDGSVRTEKCITTLPGGNTVGLDSAIGRSYSSATTKVNGRENLGHAAAYIDNGTDIEMTVKSVATGIEGPRELFLVKPVSDLVYLGAFTLTGGTLDFSSIPANYTDLIVSWIGRCDQAANQGLFARFNADATANYDYQGFEVQGVTYVTPFPAVAATGIRVGVLPGTGILSGVFSSGGFTVPEYTNSARQKMARGEAVAFRTGATTTPATTDMFIEQDAGFWRVLVNAINRITLLPATGSLIAGSSARLYGRT